MKKLHLPLVLIAGLGLAACAEWAVDPVTPPPSLYARVGGMPTINALVDDFVANMAADPAVSPRLVGANIPQVKASLAAMICAGAGGPCQAEPGIPGLQNGMRITEADFNAMLVDYDRTLRKFGVPQKEAGDLMAAMTNNRANIVSN